MDKQEKVDVIREAQNKLFEVIEQLDDLARLTNDTWADSYIVAHLKILCSGEHGYLDSSANLDDWIKSVERTCEECGEEAYDDLNADGLCEECAELEGVEDETA